MTGGNVGAQCIETQTVVINILIGTLSVVLTSYPGLLSFSTLYEKMREPGKTFTCVMSGGTNLGHDL